MLKRIDFVKQRRDEGRSLSNAVREVVALTRHHGIDLRAILAKVSAKQSEEERRLTERLQESIVPLFIDRAGKPDRIGSCVLACLESKFYAFTAAHVIQDAGSATLFAPSEGKGGKLRPLPPRTAHLKFSPGRNDLDVGVLALSAGKLGAFEHRNFLGAEEIDLDDRPDNRSLESFYLVLGYSASRTQVQVSRAQRHIHQQSFRCSTNPVEASEYRQELMSQADHILLDFDHKEIRVEGRRATPPKLQGVSGGGIFQISRRREQGPLVAIATENRRTARLIVGTRIKHFLAMVRQLRAAPRHEGL